MPFYEYELCNGKCAACGGRFTLQRPLSAPELKKCLACKKPVRKVFSKFSSPQKLKPLSISDAKSAGLWIRHGWHVTVAYVVGFAALLIAVGWQPHAAQTHVLSTIPQHEVRGNP